MNWTEYRVGEPVDVNVGGKWFKGHVDSFFEDGRPLVSVDNKDLQARLSVLSTSAALMVEIEEASNIRKGRAMSAESSVKRQLAKGDQANSTVKDDAERIAKAVVRHWGQHAEDVLRIAADIVAGREIE